MNKRPGNSKIAWLLLAAILGLLPFPLWACDVPAPAKSAAAKPSAVPEKTPPAPPASPPIPSPPAAVPSAPVINKSLLPQERKEAKAILKSIYQVGQALYAYAVYNDQNFPVGKTANEAMRQLFIQDIVDGERLFVLNGLGAPERHSDEKIGTRANGYAEAMAPGECHVSYNSGLNADVAEVTTPLVWYQTKAPSGMHYLVLVRNGRIPQIYKSRTGKFPDPEHNDGREILSPENGVDPARVLHPEVK